MVTASDRLRNAVLLLLLTSAVAGCNALMPVREKTASSGASTAVDKSETARTENVVATIQAGLPRQAYDSAGKRIPYAAQPNPYLKSGDGVSAEARSEFVVADGLLRDGKLKAARKAFRKMTEKYPTLSGPWMKLGAIAERREKFDVAVEMYKKAIEVNRSNVNAYNALGLLQRRQGDLAAAQSTYRDAIEVWRDFPEAHLNLAILYDLYLNRPEQAQKHYEAYEFLTGGKNVKVRKWLAEVRQRTGIEQSFIDIPPARVVTAPANSPDGKKAPAGPSVQAKSGESDW